MRHLLIVAMLIIVVGGFYKSSRHALTVSTRVPGTSTYHTSSASYRADESSGDHQIDARAVIEIGPSDTSQTVVIDRHFDVYPASRDTTRAVVRITRPRYAIDHYLDLGAWAAFQPTMSHHVDLGIRLSPGRYMFGYVSPDVLIGARSAGVGISGYVPMVHVGASWGRFGLGAGYFMPYDTDAQPGLGWYIAISTYF